MHWQAIWLLIKKMSVKKYTFALLFILLSCMACAGKTKDTVDIKASKPNEIKIVATEVSKETSTAKAIETTEGSKAYVPQALYYADKAKYTYEKMESDIKELAKRYPNKLSVNNLGTTYDNRNIYEIVIGNSEAKNHILLFASIHAREYMTTQVLMKQTIDFIDGLDNNLTYKDKSYAELNSETAIHIIPMLNPDGVTLSQLGIDYINKEENRQKLLEIAKLDRAKDNSSYFRKWKSNINGVDLNRNFDALWAEYDDNVHHPSFNKFKGQEPFDQIEASILKNLTEKYKFKNTIAYHEQGEVIYWYFRQEGELLEENKRFAKAISRVTGYATDADYTKLDPAGYKDWAIMKMKIPSLTIEIGKGDVPLSLEQLNSNCEKNKFVLLEALLFANESK